MAAGCSRRWQLLLQVYAAILDVQGQLWGVVLVSRLLGVRAKQPTVDETVEPFELNVQCLGCEVGGQGL